MSHVDPSAAGLAALSEVPGTELRQLSATFDSFREFVERYSPWLSDSCIFVETLASIPAGAQVRLEIHLRGQPMLIRALGQVDWIRTAVDSGEGPAGVAINIIYLDAASVRLIDSIFRLYAGQQSGAMAEEVTENWELDVESLIYDAFPGGEVAPAGNVIAAEPPAEPPDTPRLEPAAGTAAAPASAAASLAGNIALDGEAMPWSLPALKPIGGQETPPPNLTSPDVEESEAAMAGELEEIEVPERSEELEVELDEGPEISLEPEAVETSEISPEPEAAEPEVSLESEVLGMPDMSVDEPAAVMTDLTAEPEVSLEMPDSPVEEPEAAVEMPHMFVEEPAAAVEKFDMFVEEPEAAVEAPLTIDFEADSLPAPAAAAPAEPTPPSPAPAGPVRPPKSDVPDGAFEEQLSAAFSESQAAAEASSAASDWGLGLVEPNAAAAAPEPDQPPLEDDEADLPEPVAPPPSLPTAGLSGAPSIAWSTSDRSFLNRSILLFLVAVVAAGLLFIILRNRPRPAVPAPPAGEAASLPAAEPAPAQPEPAAEPAPAQPEPAAEPAPAQPEPAAEATPTVIAAPAPAPPAAAAAAPDPAILAGDVERLVKTWAAAWSAQRPDDYIACYARGFSPPGLSRRDWEAQRQARIRAPASLVVETRDFDVEIVDSTHAKVTFFQDYATEERRLVTWKTMELERLPQGWRITSESAGRR